MLNVTYNKDYFYRYINIISTIVLTIRKLSNENKETSLFWLKYEKEWPELTAYTKLILTVPASRYFFLRLQKFNKHCLFTIYK